MLNSTENQGTGLVSTRHSLQHVLILEDDGLLAMMLEDLLAEVGARRVTSCRGVAEALQLVAAQSFDCAVLDVTIGGATTYAIADLLHQKGTPFFFCTGLRACDIEERHRTRPVLGKPYSDSDFRSVLALTLA